MSNNSVYRFTEELAAFLHELLADDSKRQRFVQNPALELSQRGLDKHSDVMATTSLFYRFVADDEIWTAVRACNPSAIERAVLQRFPDLSVGMQPNASVALTNTIVIHDAVVASQSVVAALSTIKVAAVAKGLEQERRATVR